MSLGFVVVFDKGENNWAAYVPDLPGCITTEATLDDAERNIPEKPSRAT